MSTKRKLLLIGVIYLLVVIVLGVALGSSGKNDEFKPQNEFKLDAWIPIKVGSIWCWRAG
jgi:F-type H+-transporting ATPase subunit a